MKIDAQAIINETLDIFEKSGAADIYRSCKYLIEDEDYKRLHPSFLTPLDIKIDPEEFSKEILKHQDAFEPHWLIKTVTLLKMIQLTDH